jgi:ABC-type multidrug transport system fused ATPase/permease subunit
MHISRRIILAVFMAIVVLCSWLAPLDAPAIKQVDAGLKRALVSFAAARTLNGLISVVQGTEISAQPLGVGVTLAPGQLLDPINDLVEQFSNLMLAASVAFGVQKVLIGVAGYWLISLLLTAAALGWTWLYFRRQQAPAWLAKVLVILLMLRFAVPVVTIGTDLLSQKFLDADYAASQQIIDTASGQASKLNPPVPTTAENPGLMETMKGWLAQTGDLKARFENLKQAVEQAVEHMIKIMVIFVLQTMVIPFALLWALYGVARSAFELPRRMPGIQ